VVKLKMEVIKRQKLAPLYLSLTKKSKYFTSQNVLPKSQPSWYHFVISLKPEFVHFRDEIVIELRKNNVFVDRLWNKAPITKAKYNKFKKQCPNALYLARSVISLPIKGSYREKEVKELFKKVNQVIETRLREKKAS